MKNLYFSAYKLSLVCDFCQAIGIHATLDLKPSMRAPSFSDRSRGAAASLTALRSTALWVELSIYLYDIYIY